MRGKVSLSAELRHPIALIKSSTQPDTDMKMAAKRHIEFLQSSVFTFKFDTIYVTVTMNEVFFRQEAFDLWFKGLFHCKGKQDERG